MVGEYKNQISGVAISSAGVVSAEGSIAYAGYTIPGYTGTEIKKEVEKIIIFLVTLKMMLTVHV